VLELKIVMFNSLYAWMVVYNSPCFSSFMKFLDLCSYFFSLIGVIFVYSLCTWVELICAFSRLICFSKNKFINFFLFSDLRKDS
jgi:hypothetical protein